MKWVTTEYEDHPTPGDWIAERLDGLTRTLRERDKRFEELKPGEFLDPESVYGALKGGKYDEAVALVCGKYGIDPARVKVTWVKTDTDPRIAGHVHSEALGPVELVLLEGHRTKPKVLGMVIAHELGHAYLSDHGIPNGEDWEEESATDLVTIVKGLGKLTVNGVEVAKYQETAGARAHGYLKREAVIFAHARVAEEAGMPDEAMRAGLGPAALSYLDTLSGAGRGGCMGVLVALATGWLAGR